MSKVISDAPLTTRAGRSRLPPGTHWRSLDARVHIGFRKGARAGRWLVRWRSGKGYEQATLATADDVLEADGQTTLNFDQAVRSARDHVQTARKAATAKATGPVQTVRTAAEVYADAIEARQRAAGRKPSRDCRSRLQRYVLADDIAKVELYRLVAADLRAWRERARKATLAPATLKRISNDLRAALNEIGRDNGALPDRYPLEIRDGFAASTQDRVAIATRPNVILPDADVRRLILAAREVDADDDWTGDLARLVIALAATGARFSQLARCTVADLQAHTKRLMVPVSRKGRGAKATTHTPVPLGDDVLSELKVAVAGRRGYEPLFLRWGFRRTGRLQWERDKRRPWQATEISAPFREIVARSELSADVTAYALRHSSIVRGLRNGLPVRLVAALHDTSSEMIERHYAAFIVDALGEAARLAVVPLAETATIQALRVAPPKA